MDEAWLTYRQAADKLGVSPQAARQKAIRGRWPRTRGNDGQARVQVPEQPYRIRTPSGQAPDVQLVDALKGHVETLKGENETLRGQLAATEARAEKQAADFTARDAEHSADLAAERAKTEKAIEAFSALAAEKRAERETAKAAASITEFSAITKRLTVRAAERASTGGDGSWVSRAKARQGS
jgi:hypothetical protein